NDERLQVFVLSRFLDANRTPSSGQARGHASLENALVPLLRTVATLGQRFPVVVAAERQRRRLARRVGEDRPIDPPQITIEERQRIVADDMFGEPRRYLAKLRIDVERRVELRIGEVVVQRALDLQQIAAALVEDAVKLVELAAVERHLPVPA